MRIAIDALGIKNPGGMRTSILNLLQHVFKNDPDNQYLVVLDQHEPSLDAYSPRVTQWIAPFANRFLVRIWSQFMFPFKLRNCDMVHYTKGISVFGLPIPTVLTIHDLTTLVHPDIYPIWDLWYWKTLQKWSARKAGLVIAVSKNTAHDINAYFKVPLERIRVVYHGKDHRFTLIDSSEIERVRSKYQIGFPYIITVGRLDKKKNLTTLVESFAILKSQYDFEGKLILAGEVYKKGEDKDLIPTIQHFNLQKEVIFTGRVPDDDLPALYAGALLFAFTSLHEGFGLVALEAMACGIPVVVQKTSSLSEVIGDAGILVDEPSPAAFARAMDEVINDEITYQALREKGLKKAAEFDWERAACQTLTIYKEAVQKGRS
jgi:glycosyltransferase involved in cell wall biosynthesis